MDSIDTPEVAQIIFPIQRIRNQRLLSVGTRSDREPALLTCDGACGKPHVKWTWHHMVNAHTYQCDSCGTSRRWGLGFSFGA